MSRKQEMEIIKNNLLCMSCPFGLNVHDCNAMHCNNKVEDCVSSKQGTGMQIVIVIPEEEYEIIKKSNAPMSWAEHLIKNGTPLPKGHGRLIDADELKTLSYEVLLDTDNPNREDGLSSANGVVEEDIDLAPTILQGEE